MAKYQTIFDKSLYKTLKLTTVVLLLLSPLFYALTHLFYAEDVIDIIRSVEHGKGIPPIDLTQDIFIGMAIQYLIIFISLFLSFKIIIHKDSDLFRRQKEFTENASHELQTPLAIMRSKIDLLIQQPHNEISANLISDISAQAARMESLNRSLLFLARIENGLYSNIENCNLAKMITDSLPLYHTLATHCNIATIINEETPIIKADKNLLASLINNLVTNAIRNTPEQSTVRIQTTNLSFIVSNPSEGKPLDNATLFQRFSPTAIHNHGNGIGLALAKSICHHYHWKISYRHTDNHHVFEVIF